MSAVEAVISGENQPKLKQIENTALIRERRRLEVRRQTATTP